MLNTQEFTSDVAAKNEIHQAKLIGKCGVISKGGAVVGPESYQYCTAEEIPYN